MVYEIAPKQKSKTRRNSNVDFDTKCPYRSLPRELLQQKYGMSAVFRLIPSTVLTVDELGCRRSLKKFPMLKKGLVLVTGPTGSGKSTPWRRWWIMQIFSGRIISSQSKNPIEFVHRSQNCLVQHRRSGRAHQNPLRLLCAARSRRPGHLARGRNARPGDDRAALTAAATGHLVSAPAHLERRESSGSRYRRLPDQSQNQIRATLAESLKAVIAQNLFKRH